MSTKRKSAIVVGTLFILAAVTAIAGLLLYAPILNNPNYVIENGAGEIQVRWGAFFEIIVALSLIGISIVMFPISRKQNEALAIGYVCFRLLESTIILIGVMSMLSIVTLNHSFVTTASDTASFLTASKLLVAIHDWTFLFGPNLALGPSTLMMAYIWYKTGLVPRFIAILGLIGGPLIFISAIFVMFGLYGQNSPVGGLFALPVFAYEMSLGIWLIVKGFKPAAMTALFTKTATN